MSNGSVPVGMTSAAYFVSLVFSCGTVIRAKRGRQLVPGWPVDGSAVFVEGLRRDCRIEDVKYCDDAQFGPQFSVDLSDCHYETPFDIDAFRSMTDMGWKPLDVINSPHEPVHVLEAKIGIVRNGVRQRRLVPAR